MIISNQNGEFTKRIRSFLRENPRSKIAVAYWGQGIEQELPELFCRGNEHIIVCNLTSGNCSPHVVRQLLRCNPGRVFNHPRLHAKVWIGEEVAFVGSSNASSNGLCFEGSETRSLLEINIDVRPPDVIELSKWFDNTLMTEAVLIDEDLINSVANAFSERRASRPLIGHRRSLIDVVKKDSQNLKDRNIFVTSYRWTSDPGLETEKARRIRETGIECLDYYSCDLDRSLNIKRGTQIIDFDSSSRYSGVSEVFERVTEVDSVTFWLIKSEHNLVRIGQTDIPLGASSEWRSLIKPFRARGEDWFTDIYMFSLDIASR